MAGPLALPHPVGFALGGGGSLGAIQVGMLQALHAHGVNADLVAGTSIGALNGAVVAAAPHAPPERLERIWRNLDQRAILPGGVVRRLVTLRRARTSLFETTAIRAIFEREVGDIAIEDLAVPFRAMAVDADTTELVALRDGPLVSALLASSAIPGVFPPVRRDGRELYDGALVTNTPVLEVLAMGASSVVVLDCQFPGRRIARPHNIVETILYAMTVAMRQQVLRDLPVAAEAVPVVFIPGPAHAAISPLDFRHGARLVDDARRVADEFLDTLTVGDPGLYHRAE
jgi:NTE family protein